MRSNFMQKTRRMSQNNQPKAKFQEKIMKEVEQLQDNCLPLELPIQAPCSSLPTDMPTKNDSMWNIRISSPEDVGEKNKQQPAGGDKTERKLCTSYLLEISEELCLCYLPHGMWPPIHCPPPTRNTETDSGAYKQAAEIGSSLGRRG